jgi:hypothetical protein
MTEIAQSDYSVRPERGRPRNHSLASLYMTPYVGFDSLAILSESVYYQRHVARGDLQPFHGMGSTVAFGDGSAKYVKDKKGSKFMTQLKVDSGSGFHGTPGPNDGNYPLRTGLWYALDQEY